MPEAASKIDITVKVNGKKYSRSIEPRMLLVEFLREELDLTGTHIGCDTSYCGACTIILNGATAKSCTLFAFQADGGEILTVEGLEKNGELDSLQKAFADSYGLQCGYCTPGILMSTHYLLAGNTDPSEKDMRNAIAGNTCRCTGYQNVFKAIRTAAHRSKGA
jgi:aerobic-type carbon monoxide dehydrogenase small subunit (CoxS/CutS family)